MAAYERSQIFKDHPIMKEIESMDLSEAEKRVILDRAYHKTWREIHREHLREYARIYRSNRTPAQIKQQNDYHKEWSRKKKEKNLSK